MFYCNRLHVFEFPLMNSLFFPDDERMLVEPACGAALASVYSGVLGRLQDENKLGDLETVVIIVCGGRSVSLAKLESWRMKFGLE